MIYFFGILFGFTAATCFSIAYLCSRLFYEKADRNPFLLLAISHIQMGCFSLCMLPFVWSNIPLSFAIISSIFGAVFMGMGGQLIFFFTLKRATPSQVIPLLALKIFIIAFASMLFLHKEISSLQWVSIVFCFAAAFMMNFSGQPVPLPALLGVIVTCGGYALGDVFAAKLIQEFNSIGTTNPVLFATCCIYGTAGIFGAVLGAFLWRELKTIRTWKFALYFSMVFFLADICLFTAFNFVGPIFGNIVQSTRGIISIILAKLISQRGISYLEPEMSQSVILRRIVATSLFTLAIALYVLGE